MSGQAPVTGRAPTHVLCWVDGSDEACRAAGWAARIAAQFGSKLTYFALGTERSPDEGRREFAKIERMELRASFDATPDVRECLRTAVSIARRIGMERTGEVVAEGPPHGTICSVTQAHGVDFVVIGRHRASLVERLFGSEVGEGCAFAVLSVP